MKRVSTHVVIAEMLAIIFFIGCHPEQQLQPTTEKLKDVSVDTSDSSSLIPNQYIVVFKPEASIQNKAKNVTALVNSILSKYEIPQKSIGFIYESALQGFSVKIDANTAGLLAKDPRVEFIEQDRIISLDPMEIDKTLTNSHPTIQAGGQVTPWGITRIGGAGNGRGIRKKAWIMDSGIDLDNPDLTVDKYNSRNFIEIKKTAEDDNGHGTNVAGIIAARDNTIGVVGVAAGVTVVAIKVIDAKGYGEIGSYLEGIDWITENASSGDVVNMSFKVPNLFRADPIRIAAFEIAVKKLGKIGVNCIIAAGNSGIHAKNVSPANVDGLNIYTIAAINQKDELATGWTGGQASNYGNPPCDYAAPGDRIKSLGRNGNHYSEMSGTSQAAPHVAGLLLLGELTNKDKDSDGNVKNPKSGGALPIAYRSGAIPNFTGKHPSNQTVYVGQPVSFTSSPSFLSKQDPDPKYAYSYQWQNFNGISWLNLENAGVFSGVTTTTLIISNSTGLNGQKYRLNAKYSPLSATWYPSNPAVLTVNSQPSNQAPSIEWQKSLGGSGSDAAGCIQQTSDGGYVIAGRSGSNNGDVTGNHGDQDIWVVKLNSSNSIQWQKSLGGSGTDGASFIQQTNDGGYIVSGSTNSNDGDVSGNHGGEFDIWVVKLNSSGSIQWQKCFGGSEFDVGGVIQQTLDGGYVVAGISNSNDGDVTGNHGLADHWIIKLNSSGNLIWQKSLGSSGLEQSTSIKQTSEGGYIVAGECRSNDGDVTGNHGYYDYWVVKLNSSGNIQWQKSLGGSSYDAAVSILQTSDGGYIVAGYATSNDGDVTGNHGVIDYWIVKLNSSGDIQWQKALGGSGIDGTHYIQQTSDGGYVVAGYSNSNNGDVTGNHGDSDYWIVKLNSNGAINWQKSLGGSGMDIASSIQQTTDGGYIITGYTNSNNGDVTGNHGAEDFWIVKLKFP